MMQSEESSEKKVQIRKVPIETVLNILGNLYHRGIDYVDFHGKIGEEEDVLGISFSREYIDPDYVQHFDDFIAESASQDNIKVKLSDEDIDKLL